MTFATPSCCSSVEGGRRQTDPVLVGPLTPGSLLGVRNRFLNTFSIIHLYSTLCIFNIYQCVQLYVEEKRVTDMRERDVQGGNKWGGGREGERKRLCNSKPINHSPKELYLNSPCITESFYTID